LCLLLYITGTIGFGIKDFCICIRFCIKTIVVGNLPLYISQTSVLKSYSKMLVKLRFPQNYCVKHRLTQFMHERTKHFNFSRMLLSYLACVYNVHRFVLVDRSCLLYCTHYSNIDCFIVHTIVCFIVHTIVCFIVHTIRILTLRAI